MTSKTKDSYLWDYDTIDDYCKEKQIDFMKLGRAAVDKGHLMNEMYQTMLLEFPEPRTWDETFNQYEELFKNLQHDIISTRIIKGAEIIEQETDAEKKRNYFAVYRNLEKKLKELKEG